MRKHTAIISFGIAGALLALSGCTGKGKAAATPPEVPVRAARVVRMDLPVTLDAIGAVEAYNTVAAVPRVAGQVLHRHFEEGQEVAAGELLYTIDPAPYQEALRRAEGRLASDEASLAFRRAEAERYAFLVDKGAVSRSEFERNRAEAAALEEAVKADRAEVEQARLSLSYCEVRSPIAGRAGAFLAYEGTVVTAYATQLVVINQIRPVKVAFSVPDSYLPEVKLVMAAGTAAVAASLPGTGVQRAGGKLVFLDNTVDPASGMIRLKADFANVDGALWPGQFVNVAFALATQHDAVVAPAEAVQSSGKGNFVFAVTAEGTAELRNVVLERSQGALAVVREGLAPGDTVVVDGQNKLKSGSRVKVVSLADTLSLTATERAQ